MTLKRRLLQRFSLAAFVLGVPTGLLLVPLERDVLAWDVVREFTHDYTGEKLDPGQRRTLKGALKNLLDPGSAPLNVERSFKRQVDQKGFHLKKVDQYHQKISDLEEEQEKVVDKRGEVNERLLGTGTEKEREHLQKDLGKLEQKEKYLDERISGARKAAQRHKRKAEEVGRWKQPHTEHLQRRFFKQFK